MTNIADDYEVAIQNLWDKLKDERSKNGLLTSLVIEMADVFCEYGCEFSDCKNCKIYKITKGEIKEDGIDG